MHFCAVLRAIAQAGRVVNHIRHAVDRADRHHHMAGYVDQVADLERMHRGEARLRVVPVAEGAMVKARTHALVTRVARHAHAHAAVDVGDETAAVARVVAVPPAIALAEELECLAQDVGARQRQVVALRVGVFLQQRRQEPKLAIGIATRQFDHV